MDRRHFLQKLLGFFVGLTAISFLAPVVAFLSPKRKKSGENILRTSDGNPIPMDNLNGKPYIIGVGIDNEPTIVVNQNGEIRAFSAVCTHLGCLVKWLPNKNEFLGPCHGGRFDANGVNIAGPPPSPLTKYHAFRTKDGYIGLEVVSA